MPIERIQSPDLLVSPGFPSATIAQGRMVFINGQVARDVAGNLVGGTDHVAQAAQAFLNLRHALRAAGASGRDVVQYRVTVVGATHDLVGLIMDARLSLFDADPIEAPCIFVGATLLGRADYLVEIEAIAVLPV